MQAFETKAASASQWQAFRFPRLFFFFFKVNYRVIGFVGRNSCWIRLLAERHPDLTSANRTCQREWRAGGAAVRCCHWKWGSEGSAASQPRAPCVASTLRMPGPNTRGRNVAFDACRENTLTSDKHTLHTTSGPSDICLTDARFDTRRAVFPRAAPPWGSSAG